MEALGERKEAETDYVIVGQIKSAAKTDFGKEVVS